MNSPFPKVEPAMDAFQAAHLDHGADHVKKSFQDARERIIQASRDILGRWYRQEKTCSHDFYLKLFHREGHLYRVLNGYDMILVDEGQDLSPIMLDALAHCRKRIIVAGDSHQQIYSFRYAIDAMKRFSFDEERDLTMSFRFGRHIADLASLFIREAKGERQFRIKGNPAISSTVSFYGKLPCPKNGERCAVLSRTNLALFEKALTLRSRGIPFSLEGNVAAIFGRILDVYWLSEHERDRIRDPFIRSFANLDALEIYARDLDDFQMAGMLKAVREHTRILPDAVYHMMSVSQNTSGASNGRGMILSTVHGSKGQEYDRVYIDPDVAVSLSRPNGQSGNEFGEEVNIAYVSFTRAIRDLHLAMDFKKILSPEWQAAVNRYETSQNAHPLPGPRIRRVQGGSHGFSHTRSGRLKTEVPQAQTPEEKPFKVGDRVRSGCGTGTIVDADGGKYLVDLDGQSARIWEKAWGLRAV